jgi:hypothetical protein
MGNWESQAGPFCRCAVADPERGVEGQSVLEAQFGVKAI